MRTLSLTKADWANRWQVYQRLQDLNIPCECSTNKPLRVDVRSATDAIQLWSVIKQFNAGRPELIDWLNRCWQTRS